MTQDEQAASELMLAKKLKEMEAARDAHEAAPGDAKKLVKYHKVVAEFGALQDEHQARYIRVAAPGDVVMELPAVETGSSVEGMG